MPWKEVLPMEERLRLMILAESGRFEFKAFCEQFRICRRVGYKWLGRYREYGMEGLREVSRAPLRMPAPSPSTPRHRRLSTHTVPLAFTRVALIPVEKDQAIPRRGMDAISAF